MSDGWITARRPRQSQQQMRLVDGAYTKIVTPKTRSLRVPLRDLGSNRQEPALTDFGFTNRTAASHLRKRPFSHLSVREVKDSQADSDEENDAPCSESSRLSDESLSPLKRRKVMKQQQQRQRNDDRIDNSHVDVVNLNGTKSVTPRMSRFIEHDSSSPAREVPSSVSWERSDFLPWDENSPVKLQPYQTVPQLLGVHSPPSSSPTRRLDAESAVNHGGVRTRLFATPDGMHTALHTPPPTLSAVNLFKDYKNTSIKVHNDAANADEVEYPYEASGSRGRRTPLAELDPLSIFTPANRQAPQTPPKTVARPLQATPILARDATSMSRDDSPTEWYDALESLSQAAQDVPLRTITSSPPLPATLQQSTVQDSQYDEAFDAISSSSPSLPTLGLPDHNSSDAVSDHSSWQNMNSLHHTMLPPNWHSSQYDSDLAAADVMSDGFMPDLSSTQDNQESLAQLKRALSETEDEDEQEEGDDGNNNADGCKRDVGMPLRKRMALPSSDACSVDFDESLANTMLPPAFYSPPGTAES